MQNLTIVKGRFDEGAYEDVADVNRKTQHEGRRDGTPGRSVCLS